MHRCRQPRRVWRNGHIDRQGEFGLCCLYLPSAGALDVGGAEVARELTEQGCEAASAGGLLLVVLFIVGVVWSPTKCKCYCNHISFGEGE